MTTLTYYATDGANDSATATVTITVQPVNDAPQALPDVAQTDEDTAIFLDVLANDSDIDGDTLSDLAFVGQTVGGVATVQTDGTIEFVPSADFSGVAQFSYRISDGQSLSASATATINVAAVNDAPIALDDTVTMSEDAATAIDLTTNDIDVDADVLTVQMVSTPANGDWSLIGTTLHYTPTVDFFGAELLSYRLSDGVLTDTADVRISVTNVNDQPQAADDSYIGPINTPINVDAVMGVLHNDSDVDGDTLSAVVSTTGVGSLSLQANGALQYVPPTDFSGETTFEYRVSDGSLTMTATIKFTVVEVGSGVSKVVTADEEDTIALDERMTLDIPADAFAEDITLVLRELSTTRTSEQIGTPFALEAYQNGAYLSDVTLSQPLTIVYNHSDLPTFNGQAHLEHLINGTWQDTTGCEGGNVTQTPTTFTVKLCQLGTYAFQVDSVPTAVQLKNASPHAQLPYWLIFYLVLALYTLMSFKSRHLLCDKCNK